jgi:hypothetical protein
MEGGTCQNLTHRTSNFVRLTAQVTTYKTPHSIKQARISLALVQLILPMALMPCSSDPSFSPRSLALAFLKHIHWKLHWPVGPVARGAPGRSPLHRNQAADKSVLIDTDFPTMAGFEKFAIDKDLAGEPNDPSLAGWVYD